MLRILRPCSCCGKCNYGYMPGGHCPQGLPAPKCYGTYKEPGSTESDAVFSGRRAPYDFALVGIPHSIPSGRLPFRLAIKNEIVGTTGKY